MGECSKPFEEFTLSSYISARHRKKTTLTTSPDPLEMFENNNNSPLNLGYVNHPSLLSSENGRIRNQPAHEQQQQQQQHSDSQRCHQFSTAEGSSTQAFCSQEPITSTSDRSDAAQIDSPSHKQTTLGFDLLEGESPAYCLDRERKSVEDAIERYTQARIYASFENFLQEKKACRPDPAEFPPPDPVDPGLMTPQMVSMTRDQILFRDSHGEHAPGGRGAHLDRAESRDWDRDADICEELYDKLHAVAGENYSCIPTVPARDSWQGAGAVTARGVGDGSSISSAYIQLCSNHRCLGDRTDPSTAPSLCLSAGDDVIKQTELDDDDEDDGDDEDDDDEDTTSDEDEDDDGDDDDCDCNEDERKEELDIVQC